MSKGIVTLLWVLCCLLVGGFGATSSRDDDSTPDYILVNARVYSNPSTGTRRHDRLLSEIAVRRGRVLQTGRHREVQRRYPHAKVRHAVL